MTRLTAVAAAILLSATTLAAPSFASDTGSFAVDRDYQVGAPFEDADADISFEFAEEEVHELNDAWLGMPVLDASSRQVGYVEDAVMNDHGELLELAIIAGAPDFDALDEDGEPIGASDANITVVAADRVEWTETHVQLLAQQVAKNNQAFLTSRFGE